MKCFLIPCFTGEKQNILAQKKVKKIKMKILEISKLVDIFNANYPVRIMNEATFRRYAHNITIDVNEFEKIIADYKIFLKTTGYTCKNPVQFVYEKLYLIDFRKETADYIDLKNKNNTSSNNSYSDLMEYFEKELKPKFAYNYAEYDEYIEEARHLFIFSPRFEKDKITGEVRVSEEDCIVILPYPLFDKKAFSRLSEEEQIRTLKQLKDDIL